MNISRKDIEIMAPVGCMESLHAAIAAGADAVYFGVGVLNMKNLYYDLVAPERGDVTK